MKPWSAVLTEQTFQSIAVLGERNHHVAAVGCLGFLYEDRITFIHAAIHNGIAVGFQNKALAVDPLLGNGKIARDVSLLLVGRTADYPSNAGDPAKSAFHLSLLLRLRRSITVIKNDVAPNKYYFSIDKIKHLRYTYIENSVGATVPLTIM